MLRQIRHKSLNLHGLKLLYCTVPVEHKMPKQEVTEFRHKLLRPFSKDMLLNHFNLDLFTYPEIYTNAKVDKVNGLTEKLENLFQIMRQKGDARTDIMRGLSQSGIMGLCVPERYGGAQYDYMMLARLMEVLAAADVEYALDVLGPQLLATQAILLGGNEQQHSQYLPSLAAGADSAAVAMRAHHSDDMVSLANIAVVARLDDANGQFVLDGVSAVQSAMSADTRWLIVLAKVSDRLANAFVVDTAAEGVSISANDVRFDGVRVAANQMLAGLSGLELARRVVAVGNVLVAACSSGIAKELIHSANEFICDRTVFGRPLAQHELVEYRIAKLASDAYGAESAAFFTAGILDVYSGNDLLVESCLAKINGLEAVSRSVELTLRLMGSAAASGGDDSRFYCAYGNARSLLFRQTPPLLAKQSVLRESINYVMSTIHSRKSISDYVARISGKDNLKAVIGNKLITDSFTYNLHPRLGELTYKLYRDLRKMKAFIEKASRAPEQGMLKEDVTLEKLGDVLGHLYSIIATLSRASRSISIGLRNHDQEVNVAEFHYTERVHAMRADIEELNRLWGNVQTVKMCAETVKEMGGSLLTEICTKQ